MNEIETRPSLLSRLRRHFVTALATLAMAVAASIGLTAIATPAEAASAGCSKGRCTVWLSNAETRALGSGRIPPVMYRLGPVTPVAVASAKVHIWIAKQYGKQGKCSGFRLSIYPWETQGYFGYRC